MPINEMREKIDRIDGKILELIEERTDIVKKIGISKRKQGLQIIDVEREADIVRRLSSKTKLNKKFIRKVFEEIITYCRENE